MFLVGKLLETSNVVDRLIILLSHSTQPNVPKRGVVTSRDQI